MGSYSRRAYYVHGSGQVWRRRYSNAVVVVAVLTELVLGLVFQLCSRHLGRNLMVLFFGGRALRDDPNDNYIVDYTYYAYVLMRFV